MDELGGRACLVKMEFGSLMNQAQMEDFDKGDRGKRLWKRDRSLGGCSFVICYSEYYLQKLSKLLTSYSI